MGTIKESTIQGVKWSAVERFSVQGIIFLVGLIMARLLTPSDFGIVGMLSIFLAVSQTFIDSGFSNALIRKIDRTDLDCSTAFYFNVVIGAVCYAILFGVAPIIASFYNMPILKDVTRVLAITLFLNSLTVVQVALLTVKVNFRTQAKVNLCSSLVSGGMGIFLAYTGWGVWALVYQQICRSAINVLLFWIAAKWRPMFKYSWDSFYELFSYGSKLLLSGLLHTFYLNVTNLVIGKFYSSKDLGFYDRGQQLGKIPMETTVNIFQRVTFPILATIQNDNEHLISAYRKYIKVSSILIFFCIFLLAALAKPIIVILLTEKWNESIIYLQLYCLAHMLNHITRINLNLLQVKGRSDIFLKIEVIKKIIGISILMISIPFGLTIMCWLRILTALISLAINTYYTGILIDWGFWEQFKSYLKSLVLSILLFVIIIVSISFFTDQFVKLSVGILSGASFFFLSIFLLNFKEITEIKSLLKPIKKNEN